MLLKLPVELQRMVVEELRLPRLPLGTRRCLNPDFIVPRWALHSLCLTSRHFHDLAEPLLYESIALTEDTQFVQLLNSLLANRDRRSWIRRIACPMCIMEETDTMVVLPLWNQIIAPKKGMDLNQREKRALQLAGLELDHILEEDRWINDYGSEESGCGLREDEWAFCDQLLAVIICLTTCLEDLLLQIPTDKEGLGGFDNLARALGSGVNAHETGVLQSLRSFRIQPTRSRARTPGSNGPDPGILVEPRNVEPGRDPGFGIDPLRLFSFEIRNVEEVDICGDNGIWFRLLKASHGPWTDDTLPHDLKRFRSLKTLKLNESRTLPSYLRHLLEEAHSLETFHYTTRQQEWRQEYWSPEYDDFAFMPFDVFSMNEALWPIRKTVKELSLGSVCRPWDDGDEEYQNLELIVLLGLFEKLTHLSIDLRWLVPITLDLEEDVALVPLYKRLPQSLKEITLTETWTRTDLRALSEIPKVERRSMAWVQAVLWTLLVGDDGQEGKSKRLAHLDKVILVAVPAFHNYEDGRPDADDECVPLKTDEGVEEMKSVFAKYGVEFHVEWFKRI
ncbi:hypothetical protein N8I77_002340 [Diaporthe amygdali]|uniref:Uncharacterized protein n=1 Tax=Phomopsis amygdali TaxID=1214568 RepID=A0AAD9SSR5_PHOAM|nr:hypothetical protein N8I77_002340 [Diaporthe amygdali]